jgi:hypothetical protein
MSPDSTPTTATPAEDVLSAIEQQLRRLKSAVSHLQLSETAATTAISAAEQVLQGQASLGQQLADYVSRLPQPTQDDKVVQQLEQLTLAIGQQQELLRQTSETLGSSAAYTDASALRDPSILSTLQKVLEQHEQLAATLSDIGAQLGQGLTHHLSRELDDLLKSLVEPLAAAEASKDALSLLKQKAQDISQQIKHLSTSSTQQYQEVAKRQQGLTDGLKLRDERDKQLWQGQTLLAEQTAQAQATLAKISQQLAEQLAHQKQLPASLQTKMQDILQQLAVAQQKPLSVKPAEPDYELRQQVATLTQTVMAQQATLKRQQMVGLITLLATLASLGLYLLQG